MFFKNVQREIVHFGNMITEMSDFVKMNRSDDFDLLIGSDSQRKGLKTIHATVVFLWNLNTRKFKFYFSRETIPHVGHLPVSVRLITEATRSLEIASKLAETPLLDLVGDDNMEVHLDVGLHGKSKEVVSTVTGMVKGSGFQYKIKPDAWLASCVADKLSK